LESAEVTGVILPPAIDQIALIEVEIEHESEVLDPGIGMGILTIVTVAASEVQDKMIKANRLSQSMTPNVSFSVMILPIAQQREQTLMNL
jgi:hypothetical protein